MKINFDELQSCNQKVPFRPQLKSTTDTRYFDDFSSPEYIELYADIKKREDELKGMKKVEVLQSDFIGFTFKHNKSS